MLGLAGSSLVGQKVQSRQNVRASKVAFSVSANGLNVKKGINKAAKGGAPNTGTSKEMAAKGWTDAQGRKGKGYGVYRFEKKYGANVDGYSPIFTPNEWSETGDTYSSGFAGLAVWCVLSVANVLVDANSLTCFK